MVKKRTTVKPKSIKPKFEQLELNEAYQKVLNWFFAYPTREITLTDLTKLVNISKTTANRIVTQLADEEFLKIEKLGKLWRISCNQSHPYNMTLKIAYNLSLIYQSGIIERVLELIPNPTSMVLFGSYRKGDDIESSDIDIAVETLGDEEMHIIEEGIVPNMGYRKNIKVNLIKFCRNKIDLNMFANIANGILLYGFLEVRP